MPMTYGYRSLTDTGRGRMPIADRRRLRSDADRGRLERNSGCPPGSIDPQGPDADAPPHSQRLTRFDDSKSLRGPCASALARANRQRLWPRVCAFALAGANLALCCLHSPLRR